MSEAVATVGGDIVNGDVQHAHDGRAIDVLSTHLPAGSQLDTLTSGVRHAHKDVRGRWHMSGPRRSGTPSSALDTADTVTVSALEQGLCPLLDATQCRARLSSVTTSSLAAEPPPPACRSHFGPARSTVRSARRICR